MVNKQGTWTIKKLVAFLKEDKAIGIFRKPKRIIYGFSEKMIYYHIAGKRGWLVGQNKSVPYLWTVSDTGLFVEGYPSELLGRQLK